MHTNISVPISAGQVFTIVRQSEAPDGLLNAQVFAQRDFIKLDLLVFISASFLCRLNATAILMPI